MRHSQFNVAFVVINLCFVLSHCSRPPIDGGECGEVFSPDPNKCDTPYRYNPQCGFNADGSMRGCCGYSAMPGYSKVCCGTTGNAINRPTHKWASWCCEAGMECGHSADAADGGGCYPKEDHICVFKVMLPGDAEMSKRTWCCPGGNRPGAPHQCCAGGFCCPQGTACCALDWSNASARDCCLENERCIKGTGCVPRLKELGEGDLAEKTSL